MSKVDELLCMGCMSGLKGNGICPHCGYDPEEDNGPEFLQVGSVLDSRYMVGAAKGCNGEGVLYIGYDERQRRRIWLREYFPEAIAAREETGLVSPREGCDAQFKAFLSGFEDICTLVRRLGDTGQVIPIRHTFRANGTIYAVYSYLHVVNLESHLARKGGSLPVAEALRLLSPLFDMVGQMHTKGEIHRGISPYTIYIDEEQDKAYLGDFLLPAARTGGSELGAHLANGYSAPEQYASNGWQGAWTDVYALAAVFYRTVSGVVPPRATLVGTQRQISPLLNLVDNITYEASMAVEQAMRTDSEKRTQSAGRLLRGLAIQQDDSKTAVFDTALLNSARAEAQEVSSSKGSSFKYVMIALIGTAAMLGIFLWFMTPLFFPSLIPSSETPQKDSSSGSQPIQFQPDESVLVPESSDPAPDISVPDFTSMTLEEVRDSDDYESRFILDIREEYSDIYPLGTIYDQAPKTGTPMPNRGTVILYVSRGSASIEMPDLAGMTVEEAAQELYYLERKHGVSLPFNAYEVYEQGADEGTIVRTMPASGDKFKPSQQEIMVFVAIEGSAVNESVEKEDKD